MFSEFKGVATPLKCAATGLGIILQVPHKNPGFDPKVLETETGRRDEFLFYLKRIEFQAAILADNPKYLTLDLESTQDLMNEKSTDLMTAIIKFFNAALNYFARGFFGMSICIPTKII